MTRAGKRILRLVAVLFGSGCGGNVAPTSPTWEADVYPILQGQCSHCHGSTWETTGGGRYDFFDLSKCGEDMEFEGPVNYSTLPNTLLVTIDPPSGPSLMPPPPASVLEDWEVQTIKNWAKLYKSNKEKSRGTRSGNHSPKILITSEYPDKVGDELKVSYRFEDIDGDPVIGVLKFGDKKIDLLKFSGQVTFTGYSAQSGDTITLSANLCDGWGKTSKNIKDLEKE